MGPATKGKWMGGIPQRCNVCSDLLQTEFVDGATRMGPWAIMCKVCHHIYGCGIGAGKGQIYSLKTLEKVGG